MTHHHWLKSAAAALAGAWITLAAPVMAQPTAEQQNAIRSSCRSDFMSNCSGVTPGGAEALQCLQHNSAKLSPACRGAVAAITPKPAVAAPTQPPAPPAAAAPPRAAVPPAPATPSAATPAAPAAAAPTAPTPEQQAAIRQSCTADFMSNCSGVTPGGAEALQCLQRNSARLSPSCQTAVSALSPKSAATPAPAATTTTQPRAAVPPAASPAARPAAPPAAAAAPPAAVGDLPPRIELMIARACALERRTVCDIPPGGGRIITCLAANQDKLTPACKGALAEARAAASR